VTSLVSNYKLELETLDFDSIRQLALEIRKQGLNFADLALHVRLYNYFVKSGQQRIKLNRSLQKLAQLIFSPKK
jgi:hypothetical protein